MYHISGIFIFGAVCGVKGQKIAKNEKLHVSLAISQEQCSI